MATQSPATCKSCKSQEGPFSHCGKCKNAVYCSRDCQTKDWPAHKRYCGRAWWDNTKYRKNKDGSLHEGNLELITWDIAGNPNDSLNSKDMGWGGVVKEESDEFKESFLGKMQGDEKKLYAYWPRAFRWTCCGASADMKFGCDHHGVGSRPCTCDFCKMGMPLTDTIYNNLSQSQLGKGLSLRRGPDPRSYNQETAGINATMREMLGMDE